MKHLYFTVTNDLSYDQRMQRICRSLAEHGFQVTLTGREWPHSRPLTCQPFAQKRIKCFFNNSFLFYAEYNLRLFFFLLTAKADAYCAIDLDTILPVWLVGKIRSKPVVYDAHEYFTELKEVRTRPLVRRFWTFIENFCVPKIKYAYTVSEGLAETFKLRYGKGFDVIRNLPVLTPIEHQPEPDQPYLFFGGAVNEARGFEVLIPAMQHIPYPLVVVGDGNFMLSLKGFIEKYEVQDKVILKGMLPPSALRAYAEKASLGIGLAEREGINQFLALPNKFLDYLHAGLPQLTMNYPEYVKINDQHKVAVLIDDLEPASVAEKINATMRDKALLEELRANCLQARQILNWQSEEEKLISFYKKIFADE